MAYKQPSNPFKKRSIKMVDHKKRYPDYDEHNKVVTYSNVFGSKSPTGPYSTVKGDLMSGRDAGLGEFGRTDTKIGGRRRSGKQVVFGGKSDRPGQRDGFGAVGVGRSLDKAMTDKPKTSSRVSSDMPAVDVTAPKTSSRKEMRQKRRSQRKLERDQRRTARRRKRLAAREARRARRA